MQDSWRRRLEETQVRYHEATERYRKLLRRSTASYVIPIPVRVGQRQWLNSAISMMMGMGTPIIHSRIERTLSLLNEIEN
jgi:hypothetical protein